MNKRGQVTLFIIIAIAIVAAIILVILFQRGTIGGGLPSSDIAKVKTYFSDCFEIKTKEAILFIGKHGGYYDLNDVESISFLDEQTAYYWKGNQNFVPQIEIIQDELNSYLNDNIGGCFLSLTLDYEITFEDCIAYSNIQPIDNISSDIEIKFDCPMTIRKGGGSSRLKEIEIHVVAPIERLLVISNEVVSEYAKKLGYLSMINLDEIAINNDVIIKAVPITKEISEPEHIWFLITDKNLKFEDKNITWRFVTEL